MAASQSKILLYLIMALGLVLGFLYSSGTDPLASIPAIDPAFQLATVQSLESARIDDSLITDATFTSLRVFGSLPVKPEAGGKTNPFQ